MTQNIFLLVKTQAKPRQDSRQEADSQCKDGNDNDGFKQGILFFDVGSLSPPLDSEQSLTAMTDAVSGK